MCERSFPEYYRLGGPLTHPPAGLLPPDTGPNTLQNFPVITSVSATRIQGTLNSRPRKTFTVQFFSSPAPNFPSGFGEGETFSVGSG